MSNEYLFAQKLSKTVVDGRLDVSLVDDLETLETVDEEGLSETTVDEARDVRIEIESIISKLDDGNSGLELNRYEIASLMESVNKDEFVLLVKDANLDRVVEAHVLNQDLANDENHHSELIHEAMILGGLDHPGIPPIYDLNLSNNQMVFCTLKHIEGFPLSSLCVKHLDTSDEQLIVQDTVSEIVSNFIKIAEIVEYAHESNVIHRNIKPENLIIGNFGQVYVTAWASSFDTERDDPDFNVLRGTPLYMSPEQARCVPLDKRSDIYNFGASLFHVLLKRPPLTGTSLDAFWKQKKQGAVDAYEAGKDRPVDKPLLAICMRCMEVDPVNRYQSMSDVVADLKHYQSGQMVEVHKYAISDLLRYWARGNKTHLKWASAIAILMVIVGLVFVVLQARSQSGWGEPVYAEQFDDAEKWRDDWTEMGKSGKLIVENKRLLTKQGPEFTWFYNKKLSGGVAIEFEGEMLPGSTPGDLSIVYTPDIEGSRHSIYYLQHGAVNNQCSMIEGPFGRLDYTDGQLETGKRYKVRGEINGKELNLYLNGELTCSYELLFPLNSGYIGLYAYYENKAIDNIKIYNRQLPKVTNIIKTGDLLLENGLYDLAIERYQQIVDQYGESDIGLEGKYKLALCYYKKEEVERAFSIWDTMHKTAFAMQINFYHWEQLVIKGDYNELLRQMHAMYRSAAPRQRTQIREQWGRGLIKVRINGEEDLVREFLHFREKNFPNDQVFSRETLYAYQFLGHPEKALELFPKQDSIVVSALSEMGEYQKIIDDYSHMRGQVASALNRTGQYERVITEYPDLIGAKVGALFALGRLDEVDKEFGHLEWVQYQLMSRRGQFDEILEKYAGKPQENDTRRRLGQAEYVLKHGGDDILRTNTGLDCRYSLLLDRYISGDETALPSMYNVSVNLNYYQKWVNKLMFSVELLPDVLLSLEGNKEPLLKTLTVIWEEKLKVMGQRRWYNAALLLGKITDEEYLAQPMQTYVHSEHLFYKALRFDVQGDKKQALAHYLEYNEHPGSKRDFILSRHNFIKHRIEKLSQ